MPIDPALLAKKLRGEPVTVQTDTVLHNVSKGPENGAVSPQGERIENAERVGQGKAAVPKQRRKNRNQRSKKFREGERGAIGSKREHFRTATGDQPVKIIRLIMAIGPPEGWREALQLVPFSDRLSCRSRD